MRPHTPGVAGPELPEGAGEGSVLRVILYGPDLTILEADADETRHERDTMRKRLTRLKKTRSTGRFEPK